MDALSKLRFITQVFLDPDKSLIEKLDELRLSIEQALVLGFAEKVDDEHFCLSRVVGEQSDGLNGLDFSVGEGYLGHVVATKKYGYWTDVIKDPRATLFIKRGIEPASIFCYPIFQKDEVIGVLFGALSRVADEDTLMLMELVSIVIGRQMLIHYLDENLQIRTVRLGVLMELSESLRTVEDVKSILYIVLDMSLNLIQGPFTCIVCKRRDQDTAELFTRGIERGTAAKYGRELVNSYFVSSMGNGKAQALPVVRHVGNAQVIECPLFVQNEVLAVLAVAVEKATELTEFVQLVYALSIIGGAALQRCYSKRTDEIVKKAELIHHVSAFWSTEAHNRASKTKDIACDFAQKLGWSGEDMQNICVAALMSPYNEDFVDNVLPELPHSMKQTIQANLELLQSGQWPPTEISEPIQLLALIGHHLGNTRISLDGVSVELSTRFERYMLQKQVESQEISLQSAEKSIRNAENLTNMPLAERLTSREQDVLRLLVSGKGNKEIAQALFISEHTVKNHLTNVFQKLNVSDRAQAIAMVLGQLQ